MSEHRWEELARTLFEETGDALFLFDPETGRIDDANPMAQRLTGMRRCELLNKKVTALFDSDVDGRMDLFRRAYRTTGFFHSQEDFQLRRRDADDWIPVNLTVTRLHLRDKTLGLITARDISERKAFEEHLRQTQKMEAVGRLSAGVAHDFNNLLAAIIGNLSLADDEAPTEIRLYISEALKASNRAAAVVSQLLAFSRSMPVEMARTNLDEIVDEVYSIVRSTTDRRIDIDVLRSEPGASVLANASQTEQVLLNLCINARDAFESSEALATQSSPRIAIETESVTVDDKYCDRDRAARPGEFVRITVTDNGPGMDQRTLAHIFEPFFTTKAFGKGTGLGLATAYRIVKQHGGWINVESKPGEGTTFAVFLQQCQAPAPATDEQGSDVSAAQGSETVLLVDDEAMIRKVGRRILSRYGYSVVEACDGEQALEIFTRQRDELDLVILDLSMPNLNGPETLTKLRAINPDVKVIISSGYRETDSSGYSHLIEAEPFVAKPYNSAKLVRAVREVLDAAPV